MEVEIDEPVCLLCQLNCTDRHCLTERINISNGSMADVLCKHFWLSKSSCEGRYICATCWDLTYSFHKFYIEIERVHSVHSTATIKQESVYTEQKQSCSTEQLDWLHDENTLLTNANEVYVKENYTGSDTESTVEPTDAIDRDATSENDSNVPLSSLKQGFTCSRLAQQNNASERPSPFPGVGLSLSRIIGRSLELLCHDCFRQANSDTQAPENVTTARFTFAALLKHYRQEHNKAGYAVCCNRKYTRRTSIKMHLLSHGRKVTYCCIPCGIKFRKQDSLDEHNLLIHTSEEEKQFKCGQCDKSFATEHLLSSHGIWHENIAKKNITCNICNLFFASQPSLKKHLALYHPLPESTETHLASGNSSSTEPTEERLVGSQYRTRISAAKISEQDELIKCHCLLNCNKCEFIGDSFIQLRQHMMQAHGLRRCEVTCCDRTYSKRQSLYEHCLVHKNPECFRCDVCGNSYSSSRSLQNHKWRIHTPAAERPFCCDVCGETFVKDYMLKQHLVHHLAKHKKLNYCQECKRSFTTATVLKSHQQTFHGGGFNWICDICAKGFNGRTLFENHRLTHSVEGKTLLKHQCELCNKWLRNKKSYQQHRIRCHSSDGPVTCKFCGKESVNASALKSHIHLHHASRPEYPCTYCSKSFKTPLRLREHEATHTGTILYRCPWCTRTFACGSNMYKHKKAAHPQEWAASVKKRFGER
ncbi:zinc finger protein 808-like [Anopheles marshallii]|uniref:zinc finger protein 808-like n=1 Tax=Anopheles marshallii TaxID=1521116 RepID=UPI00237B1349|nr:zinc finger protein 808-like [Anopheles marshallii]